MKPLDTRLALAALLALLACSSSTVRAAPRAPGSSRLEERFERVVVFKDGYGLFVKRATAVADANGRVYSEEVPDAAVLGSFWAVPTRGELRAMRAEWHDSTTAERSEGACTSIPELVRANPGKEVVLHLSDGEVAGTLLSLLERPGPDPEPPYPGTAFSQVTTRPRVGGELVAIQSGESGTLVIPVHQIQRISGPKLQTACAVEQLRIERQKRLVYDLGPKAAGREVELRVLYFAPGVRWIPTYRLDLGGDTDEVADLSLQAELVNEVADLGGARVDLVVGVPNFRFRSVVSPLTLERALRDVLGEAIPGLMGNGMKNAYFTLRAGEASRAPRGGGPGTGELDLEQGLAVEGAQDFHVYQLDSVTLGRGARMTVPLWQARVPLRHLYTVDLEVDARRTAGGSAPLELHENQVWHQLELTNPAKTPWTAGPLLVMQRGIPLAQELLTYTPRGQQVLVPLTIAVNVRATLTESEVSRAPEPVRWNGRSYSRVARRGEVSLSSHADQPVSLRVRAVVVGRVEESDGARIDVGSQVGPDPRTELTWEVELRSGKSRAFTYRTEAHVG